ncbi:MAG: hypothetical protein SGJ24_05095 [Chloroflexota bacterium]|nr:hypothetical protein [Chloroflexota bacterium]
MSDRRSPLNPRNDRATARPAVPRPVAARGSPGLSDHHAERDGMRLPDVDPFHDTCGQVLRRAASVRVDRGCIHLTY